MLVWQKIKRKLLSTDSTKNLKLLFQRIFLFPIFLRLFFRIYIFFYFFIIAFCPYGYYCSFRFLSNVYPTFILCNSIKKKNTKNLSETIKKVLIALNNCTSQLSKKLVNDSNNYLGICHEIKFSELFYNTTTSTIFSYHVFKYPINNI